MSVRGDAEKFINTFPGPFGNPGNDVGDLIRQSSWASNRLSRANDDIPSDDPELSLPAKAGVIYEIRAFVCFRSESGTPNLQFGVSGPAGAKGAILGVGINIDSTNVQHAAQDLNATRNIALTGGVTRVIFIPGEIGMGDVDGNVSVIWAQQNSNAEPTIRLERSWFNLVALGQL